MIIRVAQTLRSERPAVAAMIGMFAMVNLAFGVMALASQSAERSASPPPRPFKRDKKWGYVNQCAEIVVAPGFDWAGDFAEGLAAVRSNESSAYLRPNGAIAFTLDASRRAVSGFSEGRALFAEAGRVGFIDARGNVAIPATFDNASDYSEGFAPVFIRSEGSREAPTAVPWLGRWGFIDAAGNVAIPASFDSVESFAGGYAAVHRNGRSSYIDTAGQQVSALDWSLASGAGNILGPLRFGNGLAPYQDTGGAVGFIDRAGKVSVAAKFEAARPFSEGFAAVRISGKWWFASTTGRLLPCGGFDEAADFREGLARVRTEDRWCFIDKSGGVLSPRNTDLSGRPVAAGPWNDAEDFRYGLARVHAGGTFVRTNDGPSYWSHGVWYYVDRCGRVVAICRGDDSDAVTKDPNRSPFGREF
jgi:hypothetical protein